MDELKRTLELGRPHLGDMVDDLESLARTRERLNAYSRAINTPVGDTGATPYRAMGELSLLHKQYEEDPLPRLDVPAMAEWSRGDFQVKEELVAELQTRVSSVGIPREHRFWGSRLTVLLPTHQEQLVLEVSAAHESLSRLTKGVGELAGTLGLVAPTGPTEAQALALGALRALEAPDLHGVDVASPKWLHNREDLVSLVDAGAKLDDLHKEFDGVLLSDAWEQDAEEARRIIDEHRGKWWRPLSREYRWAKQRVASYCLRRPPSGMKAQLHMLDAILEAQRQSNVLSHHSHLAQELFGPKWRREQSDWGALTGVSQYLQAIHGDVNGGTLPGGILEFLAQGRSVDAVIAAMTAAEDARSEHESAVAALVLSLDLDEEVRYGKGDRLGSQPYPEQLQTFTAWDSRIESLHGIVGFNNIAESCRGQDLRGVVEMAANWPRADRHLTNAFRRAWYEKVMEMALAGNPVFQVFDGDSHRQIVDRFRSLDVTSLNHNRARIANSHWGSLPQREAGGQLGILLRQFALRRRHLPIRKLLEQAGNAVQAIKPVFMMSPLSIAAYIPPGSLHFDLVVFDEASQVRPVEALGAILRGRQVVVMGDDKQLPPTRFFDSIAQGDDQDDDSPTADIQSILEIFASKVASQRMLRWHYRSRHESLITVSNQEFYDSNLLIFPSPDARREDVGLRFHHLANTVYDRGRSSTNLEEAKAVALAVMDHARDYPDMTLGVAAFSVKQMQAILDQVELLRREDPSHEDFFNSHPYEPFFVKNLETVQGDERDVIFISVGYGRDASGRLDMNFGPLNGDGGERRLNVLITRAKQRCEVFTNLEADDIDLGRTNARGVQVLKIFLAYCQHGTLEIPVENAGEGVNPFEEAVALALRGEGYDVRHQVGAAGYFIDLAVVDPAKPGRFLLGVECDGASYHSARWARDRDRLRQQVLEGLGWELYRIWSTDWYRQPQRELERAVQAIEQAKKGRTNQGTGPATATAAEGAVPREENREGAKRPDALPGYEIAELTPPVWRRWELRDAPPRYLAPFVENVVFVESPVHTAEVSRRIADAFGTKLGRRIQQAIDNAIAAAVRSKKIRRAGIFLWRPDMTQPVLRDRTGLPAASRKLEFVPAEEVALAVHRVVSGAYGIRTEEAVAAAGRVLGFGRITAETRTDIELAIRKMVQSGELHDQGGQLMSQSLTGA